jgi:hypothetical protein
MSVGLLEFDQIKPILICVVVGGVTDSGLAMSEKQVIHTKNQTRF